MVDLAQQAEDFQMTIAHLNLMYSFCGVICGYFMSQVFLRVTD